MDCCCWLRRREPSNGNGDGLRNNGDSLSDYDDDGLETPEQFAQRWRSIRIIYFTMFLMSLGFSVVLTGIWPFLDKLDPAAGKEFMGYVVAANPIGQMLFSPLFGWWGNRTKSVRVQLFCSIAVFALASAMYSSLEMMAVDSVKYWMWISRFLVGVGSANITLCRSYLSAATRLRERTGAVSMVSLAQVLGFIVGPALQAIVTPLGERGVVLPGGWMTLNMYTAAGWLNALLAAANFCLFLPYFFTEHRIAAREVMIQQGKGSEKDTYKGIKPDFFSTWSLIVAFFVLVFNFVLLETIGTSLTMDQFAWSKSEALYYMGLLMSAGAIVACVTFVCIAPLCKRFAEHNVLLWGGFLPMAIGRLLYIPWGDAPAAMATWRNVSTGGGILDFLSTKASNGSALTNVTAEMVGCPAAQLWCATTPALTMTQFLLGYLMTSIGYPIGVTLIQTIFSKILGPRPQGVWMGTITASGCLSRIMGPVCVGFVYTRYGTYATFGGTAAMMVLAMMWMWWFRERFVVADVVEKLQPGKSMEMETFKDVESRPLQS